MRCAGWPAGGTGCQTVKTAEMAGPSGYDSGKRLRSKLTEPGVPDALEIVERPWNIKGFTVLCRRRAVERASAWMSRCRRLAHRLARGATVLK